MSKLTKSIIGITTVIWLSGAIVLVPMTASAATLTTAQINAIVSLLQSFGADQTTISNVQASLSGTPTTPVTPATGLTFSTKLTLGSKGTAVTNLQTALKSDVSVYPEGLVTGYFGAKTKAAVIKFQIKYGISPAAGYVGALTNAKLNALYGGGVVTPGTPGVVTPAGTGLSLTAAVQPAATLAPGGAARIPFTKVTFTAGTDGDVVVSGVNVERTGLAVDAVFSGVVLLDENGQQLGIAKTFNSDHKLIVGDPFTVKAGQSRTMTIAGNMSGGASGSAAQTTYATYAGQVAYLSVTGAVTSATVSGVLPVTGAGNTINGTLYVGSVTAAKGVTDPSSNQSKEVGVTAYTFSAVRLTAGSAEKIRVKSIRWNQAGSAAMADLANLKTYVDGVAYDTVVSSDGKYYTSMFGEGIVVDKGANFEAAIKGDVVGGSGRTIKFDVYKNTDIYLTGETYGYGITPPNGDQTDCSSSVSQGEFCLSTNPWYNAYIVSVSNGTLNVAKATAVAAQNVAINLSNQPLGGFTVEVKGEPISVASMYFRLGTTNSGGTGQVADITNISLVDENGTVVAGPQDGVGAALYGYVRFTDTVTFPIGKKTYILKGKLGTDFGTNDTVIASTTPSSDWTSMTGQTTGNSITATPTSSIQANTMTVKSTALTISVSGDPVAQTVVSGGTFTFANYRFDASASGEDVRLANVPLAYYTATAANGTNLTSCQLYDGSTPLNTGSNIVNPVAITTTSSSTAFTFDGTGLVVQKGTVKTLALKCNIAGGATGTYYWGIYNSGFTSLGTGLTSGQSFTPTVTTNGGQAIALTSGGTLTVTDADSVLPYAIVNAGTTNVPLEKLKFHAENEAINLQKISLKLTTAIAASASSSALDLVQVTLWDGATQVGTAIFTTTNYATSTLSITQTQRDAGIGVVPKGGNKEIIVKGDLAAIGTSQPGTQGHLITVDYNGTDLAGTQGIGQNSGTTISSTSSSSTASKGVRLFRGQPIFTSLATPTVPARTIGAGGEIELYRFSVRADPATGNGIGLYQITVNLATTTGSAVSGTTTVTGLKVFAYDSACANAVPEFTSGEVEGTIVYTSTGANTKVPFSAVLPIPAGETRCLKVKGTVTFTAGSGTPSGSVTINISSDTAYPALSATLLDAAATVAGSHYTVWSPNATTTSGTGHLDWTNGYYVSGLSGMDPVTISK